ncbi:CHAT domain-containing protein [Actinoplanes couchii]|uniref:CHAT domain-containing protein n=1 Tax=Actinoplanes couchii TaxID=403638 RepID=A0ABQ3X875_9ACTN|nr:CHAT domain-containing protein [Actinoplanes couchii]MDR6320272.1 hypothetical protein [Actinoplanes couchii]GID54713.1 hypothetical protein Aco03nite_031170 [Actinoplanes couchii]
MSDQDDNLARCAAIAGAVAGHGDLDGALRDFGRLPHGMPGRAGLAAGLVQAILRGGEVPPANRIRALPELLAVAATDPPKDPAWLRVRATAEIMLLLYEPADPGGNLKQLEELAAQHTGDPALLPLFMSGRMALKVAAAIQQDDRGALARMPAEVAEYLAGLPPEISSRPEADVLTRMTAMVSERRYDPATVRETFANLPAEGPLRQVFEESSADLDAFTGLSDDDTPRMSDAALQAMVDHADRADTLNPDRALLHSQAGMAAIRAGRESDPARIELGLAQLRTALDIAGPDHPQRVFYLGVLATALLRRYEVSADEPDLRAADELLVEARTLAGGPHHAQWQMISELSGAVRHTLGDRTGFDPIALDGLRGAVWQVLIQPDLASATAAVRTAGSDAIDVARQYLANGDPGSAITALDAGRGLALYAATATGSLGEHLAAAGKTELAARWRTAAATGDPAALSADLRRDVMTVLAQDGATSALFDPPGYAEIQRALVDLDADALVYLVPGAENRPGNAVIAPASGPPAYLTLTSLTPSVMPRLDDYLTALARRDMSAGAGPAGDLDERLTEIGRWAWDAAMAALIETYLPRLPVHPDRPPRIVLIPMGDLARVPWQAARRPDGRYAVELIALSQTASARMLVRSAGLPAVVPGPAGLIVGDPESSADPLPAARREAYAIRQVFYPGARYLGRRPDDTVSRSGRGTAAEVRAWLTTPGPVNGGVLHLACHGFVQTGGARATAYLQLAGADTGPDAAEPETDRLTAAELVALLGGVPERDLGLVVLAACRTGISLSGYDEAYSLATAFLAGGARTVLSSQWSVPDAATSVLMFMVHHNLRVRRRPAWAALRDAQLWMLDPDREIPPDMPAGLRHRLDRAGLAAVVAWAAFVHGGQ